MTDDPEPIEGSKPILPADWTNRGKKPGPVPRASRNQGERGKGVTKSPSESVGDGVEQESQLRRDPFDSGKKPSSRPKKPPGQKDGPGAAKTNLFVDADQARQTFHRLAVSRYPNAQPPDRSKMTETQRAMFDWRCTPEKGN